MNGLISQAIDLKYTSTVILGDFNFPEIDWNTWAVSKNENHPAFHFIECIRDNFLYQHSDSFTRFREGQDPSCLDPVLTDKEEIIEDLKIGDKQVYTYSIPGVFAQGAKHPLLDYLSFL